jgi:hypothetical protein
MTKPPSHDDSGGFLSSSLARAADHFAARDARPENAEPEDAAERWGKRIGRGLSLIAFLVLLWYFGHQLKWW